MAQRFNHAFTLSFEVSGSLSDDGDDVTGAKLREAILARLNKLSDEELVDACEAPYDTYEEGDDDE